MDAFSLVLFGFIVYAALIVIPNIMDELATHR